MEEKTRLVINLFSHIHEKTHSEFLSGKEWKIQT